MMWTSYFGFKALVKDVKLYDYIHGINSGLKIILKLVCDSSVLLRLV